MSHLLLDFPFHLPFRLLFSLSFSFVLSSLSPSLSLSSSLSVSSFSSLSLSIFLCLLSLSPSGVVVVLLLWCGVSCCVVLCCVVLCCVVLCCVVLCCVVLCCVVLCFGVRCGVWCVVCVRPKRHLLYRHHAHMLKHMCGWCRYTRGRVEWKHGREGREGVRVERRGIVISLVFFIGKTSECLTCLEHLNRMLGSSLFANFLLVMNGPDRFITCFSCSPRKPLRVYPFIV